MADAVVNFLVENLLQIIKENAELIGNAKDDFAHLLEEVRSLNAFLQDAAKYQSNSNQWKHFVKEVQVTVYRAEDLIDKFLVRAKLHQDITIVKRGFDFDYAKNVRELASNIKCVLENVKKIREANQQAFQETPKLAEQPEIVAQESQNKLLEENEIFGFDEEAKTVIKRLAEGSTDLDVIPVVGLPGLGKTSLAIKLFNNPGVSYEFVFRFWVYVGRTPKLKVILLNILKTFPKRTEEYEKMDEKDLSKMITKELSKGGKCLIVLDDVWMPTIEIVFQVMKVFPKNNKGHRIMITTRDGRVGLSVNDDPHSLKFLETHESFQLLENRVFGSNRKCPEDLVAHGQSIAKQCSGVPLAVVVIAGALRGRTGKAEWKMVKDNVGKHLINKDDPLSCLKFVEMSYGHLPEEMRVCFLYCAAFPQGFEIPAWKLIRLWTSEGLINSNLNGSFEDIAEYYLNDLVNRNLVIVMEKKADGQVKTCRLHDMLHEFCKREAESEGLYQEVCEKNNQDGASIPDRDTCRRLCIQPSLLKDFISTGPIEEHVRSFLCFSYSKQKETEIKNNIRLLHKAFPLIRVLDVESLKFSFSKEFSHLFHLRYIAISGDYVALPATFGKFWNLQTLIITTKAPTLEIKADIWSMLRLRHLHTNVPAKLPSPTSPTGKPSCIQTLSKVTPGSCRKDVFAMACNVRKLGIQGQIADIFEKAGGISNFEELKCLENLKLWNAVESISRGLHLPPAFFGFLRKLKKLTLSNTKFDWSDANRLGQLESLEVLKLKENAFQGTTWDAELGGFSQLKVLWIQRADFRTWKASNLQFQKLKYLFLKSCDKLEVLPIELACLSSFQEMKLENTKKAIISAKAIAQRKKEMYEERVMQERQKAAEERAKQEMQNAAEGKSEREIEDTKPEKKALERFKFKLAIFPPETDSTATE